MFWTFLLFVGLAMIFTKLGAMSVWLTVLKGGLMLALLVLAVMVMVLLWRRVFSSTDVRRLDGRNKM